MADFFTYILVRNEVITVAKIGMPFMKASLSPSKSSKSKTCSVSKAWHEMNDDRAGKDKDIEKTKTCQNVWIKGTTDMDMELICQSIIEEQNALRKEAGERKMRADTVCLIFGVIKPPEAFMDTLKKEEKERFLRDALELVDEMLPGITVGGKRQSPVLAAVIHNDEGNPHLHYCYVPWHLDIERNRWTLNAKKEFNLKFFNTVNKNLPAKLREKGWKEIEDCHLFEVKREDPEYEKKLQEHKEKRKESGLSSTAYKKRMDAEIMDKDEKIREKSKKLQNQNNQIKSLKQSIQEKENQVHGLNIQIKNKEQKIQKQNESITEQKSVLGRLLDVLNPLKKVNRIIKALNYFGILEQIKDFIWGRIQEVNQYYNDNFKEYADVMTDPEGKEAFKGLDELEGLLLDGSEINLDQTVKETEKLLNEERESYDR